MTPLLLLLFFSSVRTWHPTGHFITALIAQLELEKRRPGLVQKLETTLSELSSFTKESKHKLVEAASFPDDIKYLSWKAFNKWHFDDDYIFTDAQTEAASKSLYRSKQNIIFAINEAKSALASPRTSGVSPLLPKSFMLRYLIHLVADIHQPLHSTSLVDKDHPTGDAGGNGFKIVHPGVQDLHTFWDKCLKIYKDIRAPIGDNDWSELQRIAKDLTTKYPRSALYQRLQLKSPVNWSKESREYALKAYKGLKHKGEIPKDYVGRMREIVDEQLTIGGYRLADFILESLPNDAVLDMKKNEKQTQDQLHENDLPNPFEVEAKAAGAFKNVGREDEFEGDMTPEEERAEEERRQKSLLFSGGYAEVDQSVPVYKEGWFWAIIGGVGCLGIAATVVFLLVKT